MIYILIILIFIGFLCVAIPMLIANKYERTYQKYTSLVYKNDEHLTETKKRLFTEMEMSYLQVLSDSIGTRWYPFVRTLKRIKFYKKNIKWMEENLQEIPYFKIKHREQTFKKIESWTNF